MMNLAEYRHRSQSLADFLPGQRWSRKWSSSTKIARSSGPRGSADRTVWAGQVIVMLQKLIMPHQELPRQ
jgi:hypothetical protein